MRRLIGTKVYTINHYQINEGYICGITLADNFGILGYKVYGASSGCIKVEISDLDKTWFLNKTKAEEALKKMKTKDKNRRELEKVYKKVAQIKRILMEEFPREANDEKAELVANRLYDQIMYEDKDI